MDDVQVVPVGNWPWHRLQAVAAVEGADAAFFSASPDPAALLAMLRPLARRDGPG